MPTPEFYRERADEAMALADAATLDNVRDRNLRSAKAWDDMARRAESVVMTREKNEAAKQDIADIG